MKKAIFIDLDGTLLPEGELHNVSEYNKEVLKKAQENEIYTVISTGRDLNYTERVHEAICHNDYSRYVITLNGSRIYDMKEGKELFSFNLEENLFDELVQWAINNKYMFVLTQEKKFYVNNKYKYFYLYPFFKRFEVRSYKDFKKPDFKVAKIGFMVGTRGKVNRVVKELRERFGNRAEIVTSGKGFFIEVTAKGVSKGNAVKLLADYLKLTQCAHLGDSMNDYSAFEVVKHPIAMKNASKELKEKASYITEEAKNDGAGKAVNYLMTEVWK